MLDELQTYNATHASMDLELFEDAVAHTCRVARVLSMRRGHALLVGVGGYGKQSLTKLAAHLCGMEVRSIIITRSYDVNDFRKDLGKIYMRVFLHPLLQYLM